MKKILLVGFVLVLVVASYFLGRSMTGRVIETPQNHLEDDRVLIFEDRVILYVKNSSLSWYGDTGSMLPILNKNARGVKVKPESPEDIGAGDIITFKRDEELIVHRVIEMGEDKEGEYFITKGDNNLGDDGKVRFEDIKGVLVAIIY
jgi:signal peptidase I